MTVEADPDSTETPPAEADQATPETTPEASPPGPATAAITTGPANDAAAAWEAEADWVPPIEADALHVDVDGFAGPIDMLLSMAREQKVDLTRISILALADQYLEFIQMARRLRLELAADYLVMAAWLAYLKSRLLLPDPPEDEEPSGEEMAAALTFQLRRLEAMKKAGQALLDLPQLGHDMFARGAPEPLEVIEKPVFDLSLYELLKAYAAHQRRQEYATYRPVPMDLYSIDAALERLSAILGCIPDWTDLSAFLPSEYQEGVQGRSALASTLVASLELAKQGKLQLRQERPYGPIFLRSGGMAAGTAPGGAGL